MQTKEHWDECHKLSSYSAAIKFAFQLKEEAKKNKQKYKSIKILDKQQTEREIFSHADSAVVWKEGPEDWTYSLKLSEDSTVCYEIFDGNTVVFYDK